MKFLDLFAGIGGFRLGMEAAGHECVGFVEWDKYARISYQAIHDTEGEWTAHDITKVTDDDIRELGRTRGHIHVICGGFPCQAFSVAGKRGGFSDTRGTLFFEIARFASILRPDYLFLENVTGLLSHENGNTFEVILRTLDELGYSAEWQVLNSKDFGVPQNRERVFIIGHLGGGSGRTVFPIEGTGGQALIELTQGLADAYRIYDSHGVARTLKSEAGGLGAKTGLYKVGNTNPSGSGMNGNVFDSKGLAPTVTTNKGEGAKVLVRPCLTPNREEKRQNGPRFKADGEPMLTLTAQDIHGVAIRQTDDGFHLHRDDAKKSSIQGTHVTYPHGKSHCLGAAHVPMTIEKPAHIPGPQDTNNTLRNGGKGSLTAKHNYEHIHDGYRIRKLTPRECWRLQGFPDWAFDRAKWYSEEEANDYVNGLKGKHGNSELPAGKIAVRVSDSQLYKQAGNSVTVNVIRAIAERLAAVDGHHG